MQESSYEHEGEITYYKNNGLEKDKSIHDKECDSLCDAFFEAKAKVMGKEVVESRQKESEFTHTVYNRKVTFFEEGTMRVVYPSNKPGFAPTDFRCFCKIKK